VPDERSFERRHVARAREAAASMNAATSDPPMTAPDDRPRSASEPDASLRAESRREPADPQEWRQETPLERVDRNLEEMTGELRVVVTGVQVLFAFLLIVPFNTGFAHVGDFERKVYFITLILAALAAACTIAPSAQHRFLFRRDDKPHLVFTSNRIVIAGLGFLALAMCGAVLLVASKLFGAPAGAIVTLLAAVPFALLWFAMPLWRRGQLEHDELRPERPTRRALSRSEP
jgi:Family of unknown function (DUF6328)